MAEAVDVSPELPPRMRRALELVYAVEGVIGAQVWQWSGRVAIGVTVAPVCSVDETLRRVEVAVAGVKHDNETWDFGLLGAA